MGVGSRGQTGEFVKWGRVVVSPCGARSQAPPGDGRPLPSYTVLALWMRPTWPASLSLANDRPASFSLGKPRRVEHVLEKSILCVWRSWHRAPLKQPNVGSMLGQRRRRWPNIKSTFCGRLHLRGPQPIRSDGSPCHNTPDPPWWFPQRPPKDSPIIFAPFLFIVAC